MKKLKSIILLAVLFLPLLALSQPEVPVKKIEVIGKAEMEVTPDEIYFRITLKEYTDGRKKINMDKLESDLVKAVKKEEIPESDLTVESIHGFNWNWKKQRSEDFLATKSFILKLKDLKMMNDLLGTLDERGVNNVGISYYTHSKLKHYQKDLKLQALRNAKEQSAFLLQGIDEQLGPVIEVQEFNTNGSQPALYRISNMESADVSSYQSDLEFKTIKIEAQVRAVFAIK